MQRRQAHKESLDKGKEEEGVINRPRIDDSV